MARVTDIIAGLDLGSSKVAVVIMEVSGSERNLIGVSLVPTGRGLVMVKVPGWLLTSHHAFVKVQECIGKHSKGG